MGRAYTKPPAHSWTVVTAHKPQQATDTGTGTQQTPKGYFSSKFSTRGIHDPLGQRSVGFFDESFTDVKKGYGVYIKKGEYVSMGMFKEGAKYAFDTPKYSSFSKFK